MGIENIDAWLEFGRGPLFRLSLTLMVLGLLRLFLLSGYNMVEALARAGERQVPWGDLAKKTLAWLLPFGKIWNVRPFYSLTSFLFHVGLILVPLFFAGHIALWERSVGVSWFALPDAWADYLTLLVLLTALLLFMGRLLHRGARFISRTQDFVWPLALAIPFLTGYICANAVISAGTYRALLLVHVYAGDLIMLMIPFTKIAHCVLLPLSQFVSGVGWKFPAGAGDRVAKTLGKKEMPV